MEFKTNGSKILQNQTEAVADGNISPEAKVDDNTASACGEFVVGTVAAATAGGAISGVTATCAAPNAQLSKRDCSLRGLRGLIYCCDWVSAATEALAVSHTSNFLHQH